jgi:hypothetical protein
LYHFIGENPSPQKNIAERRRFWSVLGQTVKDVMEGPTLSLHSIGNKASIINLDSEDEE